MYKTITTNIMVDSVKESMEFYEKKLGFTPVVTVPNESEDFNFAIIVKDDISIMFQSKESLEEEYPSLQTDLIKPAFTLFITVDDVKELYEELKGNVEVVKELHQTFYGKDEFAVFDNNHNILTISSHE
ncbi:VOC family protein [Faecalicatena sp. AGMB00832]|uniref:VOC family protein n=1 Tax=Faecalicatena faecalis TaxID=2726362 RepID=A0ABS6D1G6_9FIRM|nr:MULTISPECIES: VOC family protein [Faecalicatena]MBU3875435.1 VOC family protein [Faecalicatena faecalis]MCI6468020.1 VOC family protein [Faecalicatena sp.]